MKSERLSQCLCFFDLLKWDKGEKCLRDIVSVLSLQVYCGIRSISFLLGRNYVFSAENRSENKNILQH